MDKKEAKREAAIESVRAERLRQSVDDEHAGELLAYYRRSTPRQRARAQETAAIEGASALAKIEALLELGVAA